LRYDTRDFTQPVLAERTSVMPAGIRLNDIKFLIGEQSIVTAGSDGSVAVHFRLNRGSKTTRDGFALVTAHVLEKQPAGVVHITASERGKTFATADAAGNVWIRHATSEQVLARLSQTMAEGESFGALVMSPRDDGLLSVTSQRRATFWGMHIPHPESTLKTIFGKVWYEGYPEPGHTWQSSAGTDAFEPKLSLMPLIFGSIKATVYSLLFAVPLALLGAIYTSEFCHPRVRAVVKPAMELMASLPSVVLGFIAALVLAPVVETWLSAVFLGLVLLPLFLLMSAYAWQLVPRHVAQHYAGLPKLLLVTLTLLVAVAAASTFAPGFESLLFGGDVKSWANGRTGSGIPLTAAVALPVSCLLVSFAFDRMAPRFVPAGAEMKAGLRSGTRWIILMLGSAATAFGLAWGLNAIGFESRGGIIDTYVQRNTMVVGFAMGFAVIPLIYTLAEDALNAVPEHLRAASLACGGTPWQTAIWVILPAAVSGVFAAVMVGMGRAVGETMIVVMAAGNTPLIDWNIFNGLRALSANIAVELPEAVKDGTLYRVLFLAALTLFVITFLINTAAEIIRQRFRRKAVQL
ncbi:MAG: ABC transporter permease subunit, partial [Rhodospirillales bacterium]|nr:ABC transporter permease subunit [Rhodospirillales bacterium]